MPVKSMLVIDDDLMLLRSLSKVFSKEGFRVETASDGEEGLALFQDTNFDLVLLDINMPKKDGIAVLEGISRSGAETDVVMMTAYATLESAISALRLGASDYVVKPFEISQILHAVSRVIERRELLESNREFTEVSRESHDFSGIVTRNRAFIEVLDSLRKVAPSDSNILITGESGTGKELVARAIHNNSDRRHRPLIAVNCAAIPATLMESEFFGSVKGAFTGAIEDRKGLFERAHGSTIFLDEIGELSLDLQVKLLRVLQERQLSRLGDGRPVEVDFRLIAATQRDLRVEVKRERFRQDLFYRLNVFPVHLPPLRERSEDVSPLVRHFLTRHGQGDVNLSDEALDALRRYEWPGNVRELENTVERVLLLLDDDTIELRHLPPEVYGAAPELGVSLPPGILDYKDTIKEVTDMVRRELIERALIECGGNATRSADLLGISRRQLIYTMQDLDITRDKIIVERHG